ncbi:MAG TPA: acetylglutamate kinase [Candidatus Sumerlaeota bacterium]|nr:acetylglutamate kinase [Candidatus Sumerlaeota bacterium]
MKPENVNLNNSSIEELIQRARILVEALPYINAFRGAVVVIKYGGHAMIDEDLKHSVIQDVVLMELVGMKPVIVHGGGPEITALMNKLGIEPRFVEGQRVTCEQTLEVAEMVLAGKLSGEIVNSINQAGGRAVGLSGKDGALIQARRIGSGKGQPKEDIGFVGEVASIRPEIITILADNLYIPVISPIGVDDKGQTFNINADTVAAEVAGALRASKLIFLTDVRGIYMDPKDESTQIPSINAEKIAELIRKGVISKGMIPKVNGGIEALRKGVGKTHILDGRIPHSLLLELFTDRGIGTLILP